MSKELIYQRGIAEVTQDIRRKTGEFLLNAIEIGRLLFEAKAMVEAGGWGKYIEEELPFSQSWANNYMKLYKEFGSDQTSLFSNSQTFLKLRPTQALELLALPAEDREAFMESHDVENLSTRQLRQEIQTQLEEERARREKAEANLEESEALRRDAEQNVLDMQQQLSAAKSSEGAWQTEIDKLKVEKARAEKSEKNSLSLVEKLKKDLAAAEAAENKARKELASARENPQVPEAVMEQLRKEAEAEAAKNTAGEIEKKLAEANAALAAAEEKARETEEKLAKAERRLKAADTDVMEYNTLSQKLQADYKVLDDLRRKIKVRDKELGLKLEQFQEEMIRSWAQAMGIL